jgi:hypothetical protein
VIEIEQYFQKLAENVWENLGTKERSADYIDRVYKDKSLIFRQKLMLKFQDFYTDMIYKEIGRNAR